TRIAVRRLAGHALKTADARADRALGEDEEDADLAGAVHVRAATQLPRRAHRDHAYLVAILLREQRQRAGRHGLLVGHDVGLDGEIVAAQLVDLPLDGGVLGGWHG